MTFPIELVIGDFIGIGTVLSILNMIEIFQITHSAKKNEKNEFSTALNSILLEEIQRKLLISVGGQQHI
ncbi:hypothetical protein [Paenibacillus sp. FSL W7-1287]|uniref:hypothetical protein n=1 Tax=Paenibacillus sp. FSL W7-1287 TaxID=2954538 RepID=UPI0030F9666E